MKRILILIPVTLIITACYQSSPPTDPSVITSRSDLWEEALNAKDIDAIVALYEGDARILPPNREMSRGSDAAREEFGGMIDAGLGGELTSVDAMVSGDIGYNVGVYTLTAGGEVADVGKFIETWHRGDDGVWRIANDIWNSDRPAATGSMPKTHVMISHEVADANKWLAAWRGEDSRHKLFANNGAAHVHTFQSADEPNLTGLVIAVNDREALDAMLGSEEGIAAAAEDGVIASSIKVLTEAK